MANMLSQLTRAEQARLLEELNYMNLPKRTNASTTAGTHQRADANWKAVRPGLIQKPLR